MLLNRNLIIHLSNMDDEQVNDVAKKIEDWMEQHKKNSYVEILGNIWLRGLMNRY
jgi:hypothetical protein